MSGLEGPELSAIGDDAVPLPLPLPLAALVLAVLAVPVLAVLAALAALLAIAGKRFHMLLGRKRKHCARGRHSARPVGRSVGGGRRA